MTSPLLESPEWQSLQQTWLALLALAEQPREGLPWDVLRLYVDRHLNQLQPLVLQQLLSPAQQQAVCFWMQARLDQILSELNRRRQQTQPYLNDDPLRRGPFSHYQALSDLERELQQVQQSWATPLPYALRNAVLHHLNLTLLAEAARRMPPAERPQRWQTALPLFRWLSWSEVEPVVALESLLAALPQEKDTQQALAWRVLKSSRFVQAQCAAVRVLAIETDLPEALLTLLDCADTPLAVRHEILWRWPSPWPSVALPVLLRLLSLSSPPETATDVESLRQLALRRYAASVSVEAQSAAAETLFNSVQQSEATWKPPTRLLALQILARWGLKTDFEGVLSLLQQAAAQDDHSLLQQAAETLVSYEDLQAVEPLLAVLNGKYRQQTAWERYGQAFVGEHQSQAQGLVQALRQLGIRVQWSSEQALWIRQGE